MMISFKTFGNIPGKIIGDALKIVRETLFFANHEIEFLEVYFFEDRGLMAAYLNNERAKYGLSFLWEIEDFYATHDAWLGNPRIHISIDSLNEMDYEAFIGCVRHEVGHAILHGNIDYYVFSIPRVLRENFGSLASKIAYSLAISVKDFEVTSFLINLGFIRDQLSYGRFLLRVSSDEIENYKIAKISFESKAIACASILKPILCAFPLMKVSAEIGNLITNYLNSLLNELGSKILDIVENSVKNFNVDFRGKLEVLSKNFVSKLCSDS